MNQPKKVERDYGGKKVKRNMTLIILGGIAGIVLLVALSVIVARNLMPKELKQPIALESSTEIPGDSEDASSEGGASIIDDWYVHYDGYTELIALAQTEEEANEIGELYGMECIRFSNGVAVYITQEDPLEVINRGKENGWPTVSLNQIHNIDPIEKGNMGVMLDAK